MKLYELKGSTAYRYEWTTHRVCKFSVDDTIYVVQFLNEDAGMYELSFFAETHRLSTWLASTISWSLTGKAKNATKVIFTVIEIVKDFIHNNDVNGIEFSADAEEPSRVSLYDRLAKWFSTQVIDGKTYRVMTNGVTSHIHDYIIKRVDSE